MGRDALSKFIPTLSKKAELSPIYTNHSVRVTGTSILSQNNFANAQIMSVTGHKSVSSLTTYQKVTDREKQAMGSAIQKSTVEQPALPAPALQVALPAPQSRVLAALPTCSDNSNIAGSHLEGLDLNDIFSDFDIALLSV